MLEKFHVDNYKPRAVSDEQLADDFRLLAAKYSTMSDGGKTEFSSIEHLLDFAAKVVKEIIDRGKITFHPDKMKPISKEFLLKVLTKLVKTGISVSDWTIRNLLNGSAASLEFAHPISNPESFHMLFDTRRVKRAFGFIRFYKPDGKTYPIRELILFDKPRPVVDAKSQSIFAQARVIKSIQSYFDEKPRCLAVIENFLNVTGSSVVSGHFNDIDMLVRAEKLQYPSGTLVPNKVWNYFLQAVQDEDEEFVRIPKSKFDRFLSSVIDYPMIDGYLLPKTALEMKIKRAFKPEVSKLFHFFGAPAGPAWSYVPLADLVLLFKEELKPVWIEESYAYYKANQSFKPGLPFTPVKAVQGYHKGEFFVGEEKELFDVWVKPQFARGAKVFVQPKFDGIRIVIHHNDGKYWFFTEDRFRDRKDLFKPIIELLEKTARSDSYIIDTEFVEWENGKPVRREDMMWMVAGKEDMGDRVVKVNIHDVMYMNGKSLHDIELEETLQMLDKLFPELASHKGESEPDKTALVITPTWTVDSNVSLDEFKSILNKAKEYPGSEGAMLKASDFKYSLGAERSLLWAKYKEAIEVAVQVIGRMKRAVQFQQAKLEPPKQEIRGEKALEIYKRLQEQSNTWILRCAILKDGKLIPMESKKKLTKGDVKLRYHYTVNRPGWKGMDDPALWEMDSRFKHRGIHEYAYGNTYAKSFKKAPKIGDIITVTPVQILEFRDESGDIHYSWMFPRVKELRPDRDKPDTLEEIRDFISVEE